MLVALTVRRLRPGAFDDFAEAWSSVDLPAGFRAAYTARNLKDPDEVVSFGLFDGTIDDLRRAQAELGYDAQRAAVDRTVDATAADGIYEVVLELG